MPENWQGWYLLNGIHVRFLSRFARPCKNDGRHGTFECADAGNTGRDGTFKTVYLSDFCRGLRVPPI